MSTFVYRVRDPRGAPVRGELDGDSRAAVAADLRGRGFTVVEVSEKSRGGTPVGEYFSDIMPIKAKHLTVFSRQFATMISSGLALLRALYILEGQTESPKLKAVIGQVRADVEQGRSLSDSLEKHPKVFNHLYVSMVRAGETGGILEETLNRIASQLEAEDSLRRKVRSAMVYPVLIAVFALLVLTAMVLFIIPIFSNMYADLGGKLPLLTRVMVGFSDLMRSFYGLFVIAGMIGGTYGLIRLKRTPRGAAGWDRFKLRIPMGIGEIIRKIAMARFSRTLSTLISSGVPILQAIDITGETAGNTVVSEAMASVKNNVKEGRPISEPLSEAKVFPPMVTQMIAVGEETGALDTMLNKIADFYEDEVDAAIKSLTSTLEPIMMIGVGGLVGIIVIALYLPIFNLMQLVK